LLIKVSINYIVGLYLMQFAYSLEYMAVCTQK